MDLEQHGDSRGTQGEMRDRATARAVEGRAAGSAGVLDLVYTGLRQRSCVMVCSRITERAPRRPHWSP